MWPPRLVQTKKAFGSGLYVPQRGAWGGSLIFWLKKCFYGTPYCAPTWVSTTWGRRTHTGPLYTRIWKYKTRNIEKLSLPVEPNGLHYREDPPTIWILYWKSPKIQSYYTSPTIIIIIMVFNHNFVRPPPREESKLCQIGRFKKITTQSPLYSQAKYEKKFYTPSVFVPFSSGWTNLSHIVSLISSFKLL